MEMDSSYLNKKGVLTSALHIGHLGFKDNCCVKAEAIPSLVTWKDFTSQKGTLCMSCAKDGSL